MPAPAPACLVDHFAPLTDPRVDRQKQHQLLDIVVLGICAVVAGANDWVAVESFGTAKRDWFARFLALPNGIPSHDTFGRVFARLAPDQFQACFLSWVQAVAQVTEGQVIAIDGKTLRRSHDRRAGKAAIHMVSAWATQNRLVLGQLKTEEKSNEITAIPELLKVLDVSGCIVTIDAMGSAGDRGADCGTGRGLCLSPQGQPGYVGGGGRPNFLRLPTLRVMLLASNTMRRRKRSTGASKSAGTGAGRSRPTSRPKTGGPS